MKKILATLMILLLLLTASCTENVTRVTAPIDVENAAKGALTVDTITDTAKTPADNDSGKAASEGNKEQEAVKDGTSKPESSSNVEKSTKEEAVTQLKESADSETASSSAETPSQSDTPAESSDAVLTEQPVRNDEPSISPPASSESSGGSFDLSCDDYEFYDYGTVCGTCGGPWDKSSNRCWHCNPN